MQSSKNDKYYVGRPSDFFGLSVYVLVVIALCSLASCTTLAPNTVAALESLPEDAFKPVWLLVEGICLDLFHLIKGIIF